MVRAQLPALWALLLAAGASGWGARSASPPPPAPPAQQQLNELLQTAWAVGVTEGELRVAMESRGTGGPSAAVAAITMAYRQAPCAALLFDANPQSCAEAVREPASGTDRSHTQPVRELPLLSQLEALRADSCPPGLRTMLCRIAVDCLRITESAAERDGDRRGLERARASTTLLIQSVERPTEHEDLIQWARLVQSTRPAEALTSLRAAFKVGSPNPQDMWYLYECQAKLGLYSEAVVSLRQAMALEERKLAAGDASAEHRILELRWELGRASAESLDRPPGSTCSLVDSTRPDHSEQCGGGGMMAGAAVQLSSLLKDLKAGLTQPGCERPGPTKIAEIEASLGAVGYYHGNLKASETLFRDVLDIIRQVDYSPRGSAVDIPQLVASALFVSNMAKLVQRGDGAMHDTVGGYGTCTTATALGDARLKMAAKEPPPSNNSSGGGGGGGGGLHAGWRPISRDDAAIHAIANSITNSTIDPFIHTVLNEGGIPVPRGGSSGSSVIVRCEHKPAVSRILNGFILTNQPGMFTGLLDGWTAHENWKRAALLERYGAEP